MTDKWRRLRLVGLSLAGVVFVAPLIAHDVRTSDTSALLQSPGVVAAAGLVFFGVVLAHGRRYADWKISPWAPGGVWILAGSLLAASAKVSLGLTVAALGLAGAKLSV